MKLGVRSVGSAITAKYLATEGGGSYLKWMGAELWTLLQHGLDLRKLLPMVLLVTLRNRLIGGLGSCHTFFKGVLFLSLPEYS